MIKTYQFIQDTPEYKEGYAYFIKLMPTLKTLSDTELKKQNIHYLSASPKYQAGYYSALLTKGQIT